jgi:hypothetical protein
MQLLWRLRSPCSGQTSECYLVDHSPGFSELHCVQIPPSVKLISSSSYGGRVAAMASAEILARALRLDGFTTDVV